MLEARRRLLGEEHPDTLTSTNNFAHTRWDLGEREVALELMQQAADGRLRTLGAEHPHTKASLATLATWREAGR